MLTRLDLRGAGDDLLTQLPRPAIAGDLPVAAVRELLAWGVRVGLLRNEDTARRC